MVVSSNKIIEICGPTPPNHIKANPNSNNYIFENDPSFAPINLYDFFGNGATVNSFRECEYYVDGGWEPFKTTIFDISKIAFVSIGVVFLIYKFFKLGFHKSFINKLANLTVALPKANIKFFLLPIFLIQNYFLFDYVRTKAVRIPRFLDEYISLASNYNFFTTLNFNGGEFIGGNYSIYLTSGPVSAIGGVLGWSLTSKLIIARISNFYWLLLLQLILSVIIFRTLKKDLNFILFMSGLSLILIPWWQGSLYMIGEIASVVLFTNAVFLSKKYRGASIFLFSMSIFFGKLLTILPFIIFYIFWVLISKNYKYLLKDFIIFFTPLLIWLSLVNTKYEDGNFVKYLKDLYELVIAHQSSGIVTTNGFDVFNSIETQSWNNFDIFRLLIIPILFIFLVIQNKDVINSYFDNIAIPLALSVSSIYLWFWLANSTKWIRYSQHFTIIIIISLIYFINLELIKSKISLLIAVGSLGIFIDNNKILISLLITYSFYIIFIQSKLNKYNLIKIAVVLIISLDVSLPYFEKDTFGNLDHIIEDCRQELVSEDCLSAYENK